MQYFYDNKNTIQEDSEFHSADDRLEKYASYLIDEVRVWQENDTIEEKPAYDFVKKEPVRLKNINFESDSDILLKSSYTELNKLLQFLDKNRNLKMEIHGHTDCKGGDDYNLDLSQRRAKAVVDFLKNKGVREERIEFKGFGESIPIDDNNTLAGRLNNRRVEFVVN